MENSEYTGREYSRVSIREREDVEAVAFARQYGFTPLNKRVSYSRYGDTFSVHLAPSYEVKDEIESLYTDALMKLARIVAKDASISQVSSISWLNGTQTYGSMKERLGFTFGPEVPPEVLAQHFPNERRPVKSMTISRKELLKRYIDNER